MNPNAGLSPKRNPLGALLGGGGAAAGGGPPQLGFLAQLTARAGLKFSKATAAATAGAEEDTESAQPATEKPKANGFAGAARSLFADIARFRKPDTEESVVVATGAVEDKENSANSAITTNAAGKVAAKCWHSLPHNLVAAEIDAV